MGLHVNVLLPVYADGPGTGLLTSEGRAGLLVQQKEGCLLLPCPFFAHCHPSCISHTPFPSMLQSSPSSAPQRPSPCPTHSVAQCLPNETDLQRGREKWKRLSPGDDPSLCPYPMTFLLSLMLWAAALDPEGLGTQNISPHVWQVLPGRLHLGSGLDPPLPHPPFTPGKVQPLGWHPQKSGDVTAHSAFWSVLRGGGRCDCREKVLGKHSILSTLTHSSARCATFKTQREF